MSTFLHFANIAPSSEKSTLLSILKGTHVFSAKETMQAHLVNGGSIETWSYMFSLVIITDKTKEELDHLQDEIYLVPSSTTIKKYTFMEPEFDTVEYWKMRNTGQISLTFAEFQSFIGLN